MHSFSILVFLDFRVTFEHRDSEMDEEGRVGNNFCHSELVALTTTSLHRLGASIPLSCGVRHLVCIGMHLLTMEKIYAMQGPSSDQQTDCLGTTPASGADTGSVYDIIMTTADRVGPSLIKVEVGLLEQSWSFTSVSVIVMSV